MDTPSLTVPIVCVVAPLTAFAALLRQVRHYRRTSNTASLNAVAGVRCTALFPLASVKTPTANTMGLQLHAAFAEARAGTTVTGSSLLRFVLPPGQVGLPEFSTTLRYATTLAERR